MTTFNRQSNIGIYAGKGTSHSWLWFVDLFEGLGCRQLRFVDETAIRQGMGADLDALVISGGDTFAVASALGREGAAFLNAFIQQGGLYVGSCAGAYLPMTSSKQPLSHFNFAPIKITNLSSHLPEARLMTQKFCTAYGCRYIFHPVREAVRLRSTGAPPFEKFNTLLAPLYGGPGMIPKNGESEILARYDGFTKRTLFLVDEGLADQTLTDTAAAVRIPYGKGRMYLFGPHFEHPRYPQANQAVAAVFAHEGFEFNNSGHSLQAERPALDGPPAQALIRDLKRDISNSRIVAAGLEMTDITWKIGAKIYTPEKFRVFLDAIWKRLKPLVKQNQIVEEDAFIHAISCAREVTRSLRQLKGCLDQGKGATDKAAETLDLLHHLTVVFFTSYFPTVETRSLH